MEENKETKKIPQNPAGVEEPAVNTAEGDKEGNPIPAESLLDEGAKTVEENAGKSDDALNESHKLPGEVVDGENEGGKPKETPKKKVYSQLGKANQAMTLRAIKGVEATAFYEADATTFNDLDAYERDVAAKERGLKKIEASIIREGTTVHNNEVQATETAEATVYDLPNHIVKDVIGGVRSYAGIDAPGCDTRATLVLSKDGIVRLGDTIIHATDDNPDGLDFLKSFEGYECVMFNGMTPDGKISSFNYGESEQRTGKDEEKDYDYTNAFFVLVRTGNFLVRGVKLIKDVTAVKWNDSNHEMDKYRELVGYVQRENTSGTVYNIPVYVSKADLFDVIELTPTFDDVKSVDPTDKVLKHNMICNEVREIMADIQTMDQTILHITSQAHDNAELRMDREFSSYSATHRSTLTKCARQAFRQVDQSCFNTPGALINLVRQTQQVDALWMIPRLPFGPIASKNVFDDLKMHKYLEGKRVNFDYAINNAGLNYNTNYGRPTLLNFWDSQESSTKHNTVEKVLYESSGILAKMDKLINAYDTYLSDEYISNIRLAKERIQEIADILAYGKFGDMDTVSTNNMIKFGGAVGLVFGVNPNDFVNWDFRSDYMNGQAREYSQFLNIKGTKIAKPYIWCGWTNVLFGEDSKPIDYTYYTFAPAFVRALCQAYESKNSEKLETILAKNTNNGCVTAIEQGECFYPLLVDTRVPKFQDIALVQMLVDTETDTKRGVKTHDGLFRLMKLIQELDSYGVSYSKGLDVPLSEAINKIKENTQCYPQANATNTQDFPILFDSAKNFMLFDRDEYQIGVLSTDTKSYVIYEADPRDKHQSYFADMQCTNFTPAGDYQFKNIKDLNHLILNNQLMMYKVNEHEYIICTPSKNGVVSPLTFRRSYTDVRDFGKARPVLRDGAQAINGESETAVEAYLGHDDHYWINEHQYIMMVRTHYASTDDVDLVTKTYTPDRLEWDINFHPFDKFDTPKRDDDDAVFDGSYFVAPSNRCPQLRYKLPNIQNSTDKNNNIYTISDSNRRVSSNVIKFTRNSAAVMENRGTFANTALYECDLIGRVTLPSLYGHKFRNAGKLIDYTYSNDGTEVIWSPKVRYVEDKNVMVRDVTPMEVFSTHNDACKHYQDDDSMFGVIHAEFYVPYDILDDDINESIENNTIYTLLKQDGLGMSRDDLSSAMSKTPVRLDDYRYFARTKSYYYHPSNRIKANDYNYEIINLHAAFAEYGYLISYDLFAFVKDMTLGSLTINDATKSSVGDPAQQKYFSFTNKFNPTVAGLVADFFTKYGADLPLMLFPTKYVFGCQLSDGLIQTQKAYAFFFVPYNGEANPAINSKYYIDGYGFTNFYEAIKVLNQDWTDFRANNTSFKDKFMITNEN